VNSRCTEAISMGASVPMADPYHPAKKQRLGSRPGNGGPGGPD
jgi:hypothetical protein